jgi:hypothetical protein
MHRLSTNKDTIQTNEDYDRIKKENAYANVITKEATRVPDFCLIIHI